MPDFHYPTYVSYATGDFDRRQLDPWFRGQLKIKSPDGKADIRIERGNVDVLSELVFADPDAGRWSHSGGSCKYCQKTLRITEKQLLRKRHRPKNPIGYIISDEHDASIWECPNCGWWRLLKSLRTDGINEFDRPFAHTSYIYEGIIHDFKSEKSERYVEAIRRQLGQRKVDLCAISPKDLEKLVGAVFRDHLGCEVRHVGGPGDGGIDLLVTEARHPVAIQVKRRSRDTKTESVEEVRKLLGAMFIAGYTRGIIVSTGRFSKPATGLVDTLRQRRSAVIELYDHKKLLDLLDSEVHLEHPWEALLNGELAPRGLVDRTLDRILKRGVLSPQWRPRQM